MEKNNKWENLSKKERELFLNLSKKSGILSRDKAVEIFNNDISYGRAMPYSPKVRENLPYSYNSLKERDKKGIRKLAKEANVPDEDIVLFYNSGKLNPLIEARYYGSRPYDTAKENDTKTSEASSALEAEDNLYVYHRKRLPNMKYSIPYIRSKEVTIPKVGRVSSNALDSIAKYAAKTNLPLEEALGLAGQETKMGAIPYTNMVGNKDHDRAVGNMSYFRNYGVIPAENLVRDWEYNDQGWGEISREIPPLEHAFTYYKKGLYNRGDKKHTKDVQRVGKAMMNTKVIKDWIKGSPYAQEAVKNDRKNKK